MIVDISNEITGEVKSIDNIKRVFNGRNIISLVNNEDKKIVFVVKSGERLKYRLFGVRGDDAHYFDEKNKKEEKKNVGTRNGCIDKKTIRYK